MRYKTKKPDGLIEHISYSGFQYEQAVLLLVPRWLNNPGD